VYTAVPVLQEIMREVSCGAERAESLEEARSQEEAHPEEVASRPEGPGLHEVRGAEAGGGCGHDHLRRVEDILLTIRAELERGQLRVETVSSINDACAAIHQRRADRSGSASSLF